MISDTKQAQIRKMWKHTEIVVYIKLKMPAKCRCKEKRQELWHSSTWVISKLKSYTPNTIKHLSLVYFFLHYISTSTITSWNTFTFQQPVEELSCLFIIIIIYHINFSVIFCFSPDVYKSQSFIWNQTELIIQNVMINCLNESKTELRLQKTKPDT